MAEKKIIILEHDSEADTCRKEVTPKLYKSGWTDDLIIEQRTFTDGKIIVIGKIAKRQKAKKADYILRMSQNFPIAVVEAKKKYKIICNNGCCGFFDEEIQVGDELAEIGCNFGH